LKFPSYENPPPNKKYGNILVMRTKNFRIVNKGRVGKNKIKIAVWCRDTNKRKYFTITRKLYSEIKAMVRNNYFKNCDELINYIISIFNIKCWLWEIKCSKKISVSSFL
jgi:hypothetical protein